MEWNGLFKKKKKKNRVTFCAAKSWRRISTKWRDPCHGDKKQNPFLKYFVNIKDGIKK
jgi:hypothetical protein